MLDIPSSFILSSKLSPLEPKDILRLLELAETRWNERCVANRMISHPKQPLVAAGLSNPQDLQRVISYGVPVVHLERSCHSLQRAQRRYLNDLKCLHVIGLIGTAGGWGGIGALISNQRYCRKVTENIPIAVVYGGTTMMVVGLSLFTTHFMRALRYSYKVRIIGDEFFLLRDDIAHSGVWFVLKKIAPYCLTVATVYAWCELKLQ